MGMFRPLEASEIECRVGTCRKNGVSLLLYKTARVDAEILDDKFGPFGWQCRFDDHKGTLFCDVGIRDAGGEWVWKGDAGAPSNMEAQKGEASDAFKRACFKWGIGRELYSAPFVWIGNDKAEIVQDDKGRYQCRSRFAVAKIAVDAGRITGIRIVNADTGMVVFSWKEG